MKINSPNPKVGFNSSSDRKLFVIKNIKQGVISSPRSDYSDKAPTIRDSILKNTRTVSMAKQVGRDEAPILYDKKIVEMLNYEAIK